MIGATPEDFKSRREDFYHYFFPKDMKACQAASGWIS
jgi:hypothetical protein